MTSHNFETILTERIDRVAVITLNRPKALNALNSQVMNEVTTAAAEFDADHGIGAIIITGSEGLRGGRGYQGDERAVVQ